MGLITKDETVKKSYAQCDRCKAELSYNQTLSDGLALYIKKAWKSVPGVKNGWLCPDCVAAIIQEWYSANMPDAMEMPLFNNEADNKLDHISPPRDNDEDFTATALGSTIGLGITQEELDEWKRDFDTVEENNTGETNKVTSTAGDNGEVIPF